MKTICCLRANGVMKTNVILVSHTCPENHHKFAQLSVNKKEKDYVD